MVGGEQSSIYLWGVELITLFLDDLIEDIHITTEVKYMQSKLFHKFLSDILDKLYHKGLPMDRCQKDILEIILNQFNVKFNQKMYAKQQILHINDFKMLQGKATFDRVHELHYPFYYVEFQPESQNQLMQIGSLTRINSFANACHRVKLHETLSNNIKALDQNSQQRPEIAYLDGKTLILKNGIVH